MSVRAGARRRGRDVGGRKSCGGRGVLAARKPSFLWKVPAVPAARSDAVAVAALKLPRPCQQSQQR